MDVNNNSGIINDNVVSKKSLLIVIISMVSIIAIGTLAWLTWRSNETALVLTVGDISGLNITLSPYKFNSSIDPTDSYTENDYVQVEAVNSSSSRNYTFDLFYKINSIAAELATTDFQYTIEKSTNGTSYSSYKTGNFSTASSNSNYMILSDEVLPSNTTYYYRVYVWIVKKNADQSSIQGKIFDAELRADYRSDGVPRPVLDKGMIPVTILNDGTVMTASEKSRNWYNYANKQWANAVLVDDDNPSMAYDFTSNRSDGTISGATYDGTGLVFDGTDDSVTLPSLGVSLPASYSIKFKTNSTANQIIFGDYNTKIALGIYDSGNGFIMSLGGNSSNVVNTGGLTTGTYYTVDIVANSLTDIKVYLNGTLLTKRTATNNWSWDDTNSYLGRRSSGTYFNGVIEKFIVYDDVLTEEEINHNLNVTDYAMCDNGIVCNNLKLYYNFKGGMREYYKNASAGIKVSQDDILAHYVWIPKYSYKMNSTSGAGNEAEISISFNYNESGYTPHPAFTFGGKEIDGFWTGKFETTGDETTPKVLPNTSPLVYQNMSTKFVTSLKFAGGSMNTTSGVVTFSGGTKYGLTNMTDSHLMKNSEWGAVAYLSHSQYGINEEIRINNYYSGGMKTGCGAANAGPAGPSSTCGIAYGGASSYPQSTTGNITGVFDMVGGSEEAVMGLFANSNGDLWIGATSGDSGFNGLYGSNGDVYTLGIAFPKETKYYDKFQATSGTTISAATACNGGVCYGHALSETSGWYSDYYYFFVSPTGPWLTRGFPYSNGPVTGAFSFTVTNGVASNSISWRSILVVE